MDKGLVHIYTGDMKGKTTAAMGLALRAAGYDKKVLIVQFFKFHTGEKKSFEKHDNVKYMQFQYPSSFFKDYESKEFKHMQAEFYRFWEHTLTLIHDENPDLIVFDEASYIFSDGIASPQLMLSFLESKPEHTEIVMTGRNFPPNLLEKAHYITEMHKVRHPFDEMRLPARKSIEF
ncbi:cob(I)yrinic acid a,c-diamide adenosyltransferase [Candidatus Woesearchaeota archaeon]|nr:cob(I)yrinic acid a,c-diamide adenosyltransferase [Candidatus Woesearchaeota archaeon]